MRPPRSKIRLVAGLPRLVASVAVLALLWLIVLPGLARAPRIRARIDRNERLHIDPSVKFYSELPAMPVLLERVAAARRRSEARAAPRPRGGGASSSRAGTN